MRPLIKVAVLAVWIGSSMAVLATVDIGSATVPVSNRLLHGELLMGKADEADLIRFRIFDGAMLKVHVADRQIHLGISAKVLTEGMVEYRVFEILKPESRFEGLKEIKRLDVPMGQAVNLGDGEFLEIVVREVTGSPLTALEFQQMQEEARRAGSGGSLGA